MFDCSVRLRRSKTTSLLIEVLPVLPGRIVGRPLQIDTGAPGALFGIAAAVEGVGNQLIYFNDDDSAAVAELSLWAGTTGPIPY